MPALPLWSVIVVVLSVASIIILLLFCLFRCRRFPRSTVDPAEYTTKKQGYPTIVSEAISNSTQEKTICPTTTTTTTSRTQPFTPTTTTTTTSSSSSPSPPSSPSCSILRSPAHAYSDEPLSEKHHEFDNPKATPTNHHQEHQKKDDFHISLSLPLPPPSTSFFGDKMELNSDEATRMFELYMSSADKQAHSNQRDFVSIDLTGINYHAEDQKPAFYDTISQLQQKATSTIRSTLRQSMRRQKSSAKKTTVQQVFDPVTILANVDNKDDHPPVSAPTLEPPKANITNLPVSPPSPPTSKGNNSSDSSSSSLQEDKATGGITLSASPFHQLDEEADHQNSSNRTSLTTPRVSAEVSIGLDSTKTVKGRHLFDYNLDTMFAWPSGDSGDDEDDDNDVDSGGDEGRKEATDEDRRMSKGDNVSITSGSVHRLVRDSTVVDTDHRSLAARSVSNSVRPSLHEMASWWSNDNESISTTNNDQSGHQSPDSYPSQSQKSSTSNQQQSKSTSISKAMASYSSSSPTSTFSRATLNKFRAALADGIDSDLENDTDDNDDNDLEDTLQQPIATTPPPEPQHVVEESSVKYAVPDDQLLPIAIPTFTEANKELPLSTSPSSASASATTLPPTVTTATSSPSSSPSSSSSSSSTPSPSPPSSPSSRTAYDNNSVKSSSIKSRPVSANSTISSHYQPLSTSPAAAMASIRSTARNSVLNPSGGSNVDSVRRVLQGTWNTHRYSDHGSIASSTRSNLSQGMSPPGSVNPRQLNQHLASLSLQSGGRHPIRPGLPTGFMNEDLLVPGGNTAIMGPQPTVSFSSSTVRTMIPEDEPIERHVGQKKQQQQKQNQKSAPKQKPKKEAAKSTTPTTTGNKDQKQQQQQQQSFGTMRTGRQQRGTMPWNADASSKTKAGEKTPAQRERDRYLQSLKG